MPTFLRELKTIEYVHSMPELLPLLEAHILKWPDNPNRVAALTICRGALPALQDCKSVDPHFFVHDHGSEALPPLGPEICFTGFGDERRFELERAARSVGLRVRNNVSIRLHYLCAGPNAGPAKLKKARAQGVRIVSAEGELAALLAEGNLPD